MGGGKAIQFAGGLDDIKHSRVAEFNHITAVEIDQMVMLNALVRFLKLGDIFSKLMLNVQVAVQQ